MGRLMRGKARKGGGEGTEGGPMPLPPPGFAGHGADPKSWRAVDDDDGPSIAGRRVPSVTLSRVRTGRGGEAGVAGVPTSPSRRGGGRAPACPARKGGLARLEDGQGSPARGGGGLGCSPTGMESPGLGALGFDGNDIGVMSTSWLTGGEVPSFLELGGLDRGAAMDPEVGTHDGVDSTDVESLGSGRSNAGEGGVGGAGRGHPDHPLGGAGDGLAGGGAMDDPLFNAFGTDGAADWGDLRLTGETVDPLHEPYGPQSSWGTWWIRTR